jgi:hypothetical protein
MSVRHRPYAPTLRGIIIKRAVSASLAVLRAMPLGIEADAQRHGGQIAARRGAGLRPLVRASAQVRRRAARCGGEDMTGLFACLCGKQQWVPLPNTYTMVVPQCCGRTMEFTGIWRGA